MKDMENDDRAVYAAAYLLCALSGGVMGLLLGWIVWG